MVRRRRRVGISDGERAEGHAAAELFAGLAEGEWFAERRKAGLEVGDGLGGEVVAEVRRKQRCGRCGLVAGRGRCRGPAVSGALGGNPATRGRPDVRCGGGADGVLIGKHGHGGAIIDEHLVVGDEAGDFAAMFDGPVAIPVEDFHAKAVVGIRCRP